MKKLFALLLVSQFALAASPARFSESQALTRAAPSTTTTTGINLAQVSGYRITVCAESGQTLSGAGTIDIYYRNPDNGLWSFNKGLQQTISVTGTSCSGSGCRCQVFPDVQQVTQVGGIMLPAANGVTVSGGTTVTVSVMAWKIAR